MRSVLIGSLMSVALLSLSAFSQTAGAAKPKNVAKPQTTPVVAVLPFKVLNKEQELAHYGEGASDTVINKIVNDRTLRVVEESQLDKAIDRLARNQTGMFEESSALEIGQMVDARFIVIGSVQIVGDKNNGQIKVNARLLEVETRQLLVSEAVFGPIASAFQQYDEIGARLVSKVTAHLAQRSSGATADSVAVDSLIDGGKAFDPAFPTRPGVTKDLGRALTEYNKAVVRDPESPRAFLALGHAELRYAEQTERSDPVQSKARLRAARDHLEQSVKLDSGNPFTLQQLGKSEGKLGNHSAARTAFEKALAVDSTFRDARWGLAVALLQTDELEAAREQAAYAKSQGDTRADGLIQSIDQRIAAKKQKPDAAAQR